MVTIAIIIVIAYILEIVFGCIALPFWILYYWIKKDEKELDND